MRFTNPARTCLLAVLLTLLLVGCGGSGTASRFIYIASPADSTVYVRLCILSGLDQNPTASFDPAWPTAFALVGPSSEKREQTIGRLKSTGASVNFAVGYDVTVIDAHCPASKWDQCTQSLCELICSDPSGGLQGDRLLSARVDWLAHLRQDADAAAAMAFYGYPAGDSAGPATDDQLGAALQSYWRENYTRENYVLGITGPVTEAAARALDAELQKRLPPGRPQRTLPTPTALKGLNVRIFNQAGAKSVTFYLGRIADAVPSDTLTAILALIKQQLSDPKQGQLNQVLRDERELIAGVDADTRKTLPRVGEEPDFEDLTPDNLICISTETAPLNAVYTLQIILKELTDLVDAGLSAGQLDKLRRILHSDSGSTDNPQQRLDRMLWEAGRRALDRPAGEPVLDALTTVDTREYLRRVLDPQNLQIVAVCPDASALASQILNGPISYSYPVGINQSVIRHEDQKYLSYRPFWEISKVHIEAALPPSAISK